MREEITTLHLSGPPRKRGQQHGQLLKPRIHDLYARFIEKLLGQIKQNPLDWPNLDIMIDYANGHGPYIKSDAPDLYEELIGISEGAQIEFEKILFLNCVAEVRRLMVPKVAEGALAEYSKKSARVAQNCTCLAAFGEATHDGKVYLGQTYDIEPFWDLVVLHLEPSESEPEQLMITHPGIIAEMGINAAGIAFVDSAILVADQRKGVPAPVIARKILQQKHLGNAVDAVVRAERTIGIHYVIAAPFGVIDVETSATQYAANYLQENLFTCANHICSSELKPLEIGIPSSGTFIREGRMLQLLRSRSGKLNLENLKLFLQDHTDLPNSICTHICDEVPVESRSAILFKPEAGLMLASNGPACQHPFQEWRFSR